MDTGHQPGPNSLSRMSARHEEVVDISVLLDVCIADDFVCNLYDEGANPPNSMGP